MDSINNFVPFLISKTALMVYLVGIFAIAFPATKWGKSLMESFFITRNEHAVVLGMVFAAMAHTNWRATVVLVIIMLIALRIPLKKLWNKTKASKQ